MKSPALHILMLALIVMLCAGCQPRTADDMKSGHPYATVIMETAPTADVLGILVMEDYRPSLTASGYYECPRVRYTWAYGMDRVVTAREELEIGR